MSAPFWVQVDAGVALGLGAVLAVAAVRKLQHIEVFALTLRRLDGSRVRRAGTTRRVALLVAIFELATGIGVNVFRGAVGFVFACAALVACAGFVAALVRAIQQSVPCACFGRLGHTAAGGREMARSLTLFVAAGFLVAHRAVESSHAYGFGGIALLGAIAFFVVVAAAQRVGARIRPGTDLVTDAGQPSFRDALRAVAGVDNELYAPSG